MQLIQITDKVLAELVEWGKKKRADPQCHAHKDDQAIKSLIHSRLLLQLRFRELMIEAQSKQKPQPTPTPLVQSLDGYIDVKRL